MEKKAELSVKSIREAANKQFPEASKLIIKIENDWCLLLGSECEPAFTAKLENDLITFTERKPL